MARAYQLMVKARGDTSDLQKKMKRLGRDMKRTGEKLKNVGSSLTVGVTLPAAAAAAGMVKLASDADETASKLDVTFGTKGMGRVNEQLDDFAAKTKSSRYVLRDQAATIGALLKPMKLSQQQLEGMSVGTVQLAKDLSSFHNIAESDALEKLRAGLTGEAEPLKQVGILMNAAAVEAKALEMGLIGQGETMTEQQKVQARYALIMEQSADAQGDAERTSDGFANSMKGLQNSLRDLGTELGQKLLPHAQKLVGWLQQGVDWFGSLSPKMQSVVLIVGGLAAAMGPLLMLVGSLMTAIPAMGAVLGALVSPVGLVVAGVVAAVAAFVALYRNNQAVREFVHKKLIPTLGDVWGWLQQKVPAAVATLKREWDDFWTKARPLVEKVGSYLWTVAKIYFPMWWGAVKTAWAVAKPILGAIWRAWRNIQDKVIAIALAMTEKLQPALDWLDANGPRILKGVETHFENLERVANLAADHIDRMVKGLDLLKGAASGLGGPIGWLAGIGGKGGHGDGAGVGPVAGVDSFTPIASRFGLMMTSGYRPGDDGWHGLNRARDYSNGFGPTPQMLGFARMMAMIYGSQLKELIYTPLGFGIKNGQRVPLSFFGDAVNRMHNNHVHVAYARGGVVTSPHMGLVGEAGPEAIVPLGSSPRAQADRARVMGQSGLGGTTIHVHGITDPVEAAAVVARKQSMMRAARSY